MSKGKTEYVWVGTPYFENGEQKVVWNPSRDHFYRVCSVCSQEAMLDSSMCADCRTVAEETQQDPEPAIPDPRPLDTLRDWITRPCGTITDRRSQ